MHRLLLLLAIVFTMFSAGCAKVAHMPQLLRIKGYSDSRDSQAVLIQKQNEKFEKLLQSVEHGDVLKFSDEKSVWTAYGPPIFETRVSIEKTSYQVWMYRYSTKLFGSDKVYLYFDNKGRLKIYDYSPGGTMTPVLSKN